MSAFIVSRQHIRYLVEAAVTLHPPRARERYPLVWYVNGTRHELYPGDSGAASAAGQMLWDENIASVAYRYPHEPVSDLPGPSEETYTFTHTGFDGRAPQPVPTLKACDGYEYQSCEHPGWPDSGACAFLQALRHRAWTSLPGYEEAAWEIPRT